MRRLTEQHKTRYATHYKLFLKQALGVEPSITFHESAKGLRQTLLRRKSLDALTRKAIEKSRDSPFTPYNRGSGLPLRERGKWRYHISSSGTTLAEEVAHAAILEAVWRREERRKANPVHLLRHYNRYREFHEGTSKLLGTLLLMREGRQRDIPHVLKPRDIDIPGEIKGLREYDAAYGKQNVGAESLAHTILKIANNDPERIAQIIRELIEGRKYDSRDAFDYLVAKYVEK